MSFVIPTWVFYRNYYSFTVDSRSYLYSVKEREFLLLEGISSDLWTLICNCSSDKNIFEFIKKNNLEEDFFSFISELLTSGFLIYKNDSNIFDFTDIDVRLVSDSPHNLILPLDEYENQKKTEKNFFDEMNLWATSNNKLMNIFFELTYNCNEKCIHCFNHKNLNSTQLDFSDVKLIVDTAYSLGLFTVTLSGGESTLAKDFLKIAEYIVSKKLLLIIFTNGLSLYNNNDLFEKIVSLYPYRVEISLYSLREHIHDKITGIQGSCAKTKDVIRRLKSRGVYVVIKCFLTKYNIDYCDEIINFAKNENIDLIIDELFLNNPENNNIDVSATFPQIEKYYESHIDTISPSSNFNSSNIHTCKAGHTFLSVNPMKDVFPCNIFEYLLGNLSSDSLSKIWTDKNPTSPINMWRNITFEHIKECRNNEYCKYCNYCPGRSYYSRRKIGKVDLLCETSKIKYKLKEFC